MSLVDDLRALMRTIDIPPSRELHCGSAAWAILRNVATDTTDVLGPTFDHLPSVGLSGVPVRVDDDMPDGAWKLTEDGETVASGDFAPGHRAAYVPGVGVLAWPEGLQGPEHRFWERPTVEEARP